MMYETGLLQTANAQTLCKVKWLYYRGDENYGLGNVLYDVASAAALSIALNRTLIYGANDADRKFGTLLTWPGLLTMQAADELRRRARCGTGTLVPQRRVLLAPDRCTLHRTWRKEKAGHVRCFKRLLGIDWLSERATLLELNKVHAFTGLQTLLKSAHEPLRRRVAAITGSCIRTGDRPNVHGSLLATLVKPAPAVAHAVRWALAQQQLQQRQLQQQMQRKSGRRHSRQWADAPQIALHVRAMSDYRAKNLTASVRAWPLDPGPWPMAHGPLNLLPP